MIKTLRITSIIAAIGATVLLILPAVYGVRSDPKIEEFIKSPGVVDKFTAAKGSNPTPKTAEASPLIKEALKLKDFLNPPPPPPPKAPPVGTPQGPAAPPPAPPVVSAKFDIVATSYYASHPEQSFVLIDEPGKGLHWVKQGSAVGHLTIETVKDGAIVVRDGQRTSEMTIKVQESWKKLLKNPPPSTGPSSSSAPPAATVAQAPTAQPEPERTVQPSSVTTDKPSTSNPARTSPPAMPGRTNPRAMITPQPSERITSAAQPAPQITQPSTAANPPVQPAQAATQPPPAAEITPPPQETPVPEDSPRVKEQQAKIDKLISEVGTSEEITPEEQKKLDEVFKQLEELEKMREAERAKDANAKNTKK